MTLGTSIAIVSLQPTGYIVVAEVPVEPPEDTVVTIKVQWSHQDILWRHSCTCGANRRYSNDARDQCRRQDIF